MMTNGNKNFENGKRGKKGANVSAIEQSKLLMRNRLNIAGDSVKYTVNNRMIEDCITEYIHANMTNTDEHRFMVQCGWNRAYNSVLNTGKPNGSDPFVISIYMKVNKGVNTNQKAHKAGDVLKQRTLNRVLRQASFKKIRQFEIITSRQLNAVLSSIAMLDRKGKLVWEAYDKKGNWAECPLDPIKVLEYCFEIDDNVEDYGFDIIDVRLHKDKDGKKQVENPEFTMSIAKVRTTKNFKHANKDRFDFMRRRK